MRRIAAGGAALEGDAQGHPLSVDQRGDPLDTPVPDIGAYRTYPRLIPTIEGLESPIPITYGTASVIFSGTLIFEMIARGKGKKAGTRPKVLGTTTLSSGAASLTLRPGRVRHQTITVAYGGDADFAQGQSDPESPILDRKSSIRTLHHGPESIINDVFSTRRP
jgi:hypothetical protein